MEGTQENGGGGGVKRKGSDLDEIKAKFGKKYEIDLDSSFPEIEASPMNMNGTSYEGPTDKIVDVFDLCKKYQSLRDVWWNSAERKQATAEKVKETLKRTAERLRIDNRFLEQELSKVDPNKLMNIKCLIDINMLEEKERQALAAPAQENRGRSNNANEAGYVPIPVPANRKTFTVVAVSGTQLPTTSAQGKAIPNITKGKVGNVNVKIMRTRQLPDGTRIRIGKDNRTGDYYEIKDVRQPDGTIKTTVQKAIPVSKQKNVSIPLEKSISTNAGGMNVVNTSS